MFSWSGGREKDCGEVSSLGLDGSVPGDLSEMGDLHFITDEVAECSDLGEEELDLKFSCTNKEFNCSEWELILPVRGASGVEWGRGRDHCFEILEEVGEEALISWTDVWDESDLDLEGECKKLGEGDECFSGGGDNAPLGLGEASKGYDRQVKMGE